ncbi:MAG: hypothetical protein IJU75_07325 [Clostridia bacterium]|nr:hypothetical protein [Clostridia bacterium]
MKVTGKKCKTIITAVFALFFAVTAAVFPFFSERQRVMGKESAKIMLYDGEEKRKIGELSFSDLKGYASVLNEGEIIYNVKSESAGGNFVSSIDGPSKTLSTEDGTSYRRVFGGWYFESPTKLYVSNWNWNDENSAGGIALFGDDGTPNRRLWNEKKKEYRLYAYWIPEDFFIPVVSYKDGRAGDGVIDSLYINAGVPRSDIFTEAGFIIDERKNVSESELTLDGSPLYVERGVEMFRSVRESGCYDFDITVRNVTALDSNGYSDDGRVLAFHWENINAFSSFSVRVYLVTREGSVVYGPVKTVSLKDGGELLPIKQ